MLVLSRKSNESLLIGENVIVTVVRIGPNSVRLGITAPRDVRLVRTELLPDAQQIALDIAVVTPTEIDAVTN